MRDVALEAAVAGFTVETVNAAAWRDRRTLRRYAHNRLRPAERTVLDRYLWPLTGCVLELGSGGGALTSELIAHAGAFTGVAPSRRLLERCHRRHPDATFLQRDVRHLSRFGDGEFTAVVLGDRVIDLLGDAERHRVLANLRRILTDDGILIFTSGNLGCESMLRVPSRSLASVNPARVAHRVLHLPRSLRNRAQLARLQERQLGYAILNDGSHDYGLLRYYVSRDHQEAQLAAHGLLMLECITLEGHEVPPGGFAYGSRELVYAATPLA